MGRLASADWSFRLEGDNLAVLPPDGGDIGLANALWDFVTSELGWGLQAFTIFKDYWRAVVADPERARRGMSGNGTSIRVEGGHVALSSLYEQWDEVTMPLDEFNHFLQRYESFLKESEQSD